MCYEFSHWFTKARSEDQARKQQRQTERTTQQAPSAPQPDPVATAPRRKESETAPA